MTYVESPINTVSLSNYLNFLDFLILELVLNFLKTFGRILKSNFMDLGISFGGSF